MEGTDVAVSEEGVADLCKMEIWTLKNMIRPDTLRIGTSFDKMMDAVKRRSSQRHQDVNTAIERCFSAFSGRGKTSLSIHQFARRLSVLSMEWSGNFSKEEYLALAQDLSEEDTPGTVTLESFMCAAKHGAVYLPPPGWGTKGDESSNRSAAARDASQGGCHVNEFDDEVRERRGSGARTARQAEGREAATEDTLETTLRQAASQARALGQDVWKLLDACVQAALEERRRRDEEDDDRTLTSEDVAAQIYLGPEVVHRFLPKLGVRVVPSPPSPSSCPPRQQQSGGTAGEEQQQQHPDQPAAADSRSPRLREVAGEEAPAVSSFLSARNAFEARSRASREGSPARTTSPAPPSSSLQFTSARQAFESKTKGAQEGQGRSAKGEAPTPSSPPSHPQSPPSKEAPSICDRYLRALSRDTASVRCRVQFYNQELARTQQEAEALVSRAAATNIKNSESCGNPPRQSPDIDGSGAARRGIGGGAGGESFAAEVGGGTAAVNSAGGGGAARMSSTGPFVGFFRVSPVGRVDPSHPRMELMSRPVSTPPAPSPSTSCGQAQSPLRESERPPAEGGSGRGEQRTSAGNSRRNSSSGDKPKVAVSDRVAKLLLAALDESKANPSSSAAAAPPEAAEKRKIAVTPKTACFDPPTVRNGLSGLTPGHVDGVLLRVEAATPGAVSSWKSPGSRRRPRTGGTDPFTPSTPGRGLAAEAQGRRRRQLHISHGSIGWFDAEDSAKGILQGMGAQQAAAGDGLGARRKKGGGGARRKRSILKIKLPPRTPTTPSEEPGDRGAVQAAPASTRRKGSWGIAHVEWASSVDDDDDDDDGEEDGSEDFTGKNPMYARPVETVDEKNIQQRTLPAPPKRAFSFAPRRTRGGGGPSGSSPSPSSKASNKGRGGPSGSSPSRPAGGGRNSDEAYPFDASASATYARSTRRPVRAFQKLDEDVYDEFLNCAKKKPKASYRGFQRMGTIG